MRSPGSRPRLDRTTAATRIAGLVAAIPRLFGIVGARGLALIIDCHGHYTTAPRALEGWRATQLDAVSKALRRPDPAALAISDD
ncbi:MAG TPA: hypothetical protein VFV90_01455, partial [Usitatibacter sp.]|nr:hypothetical protein [Usitatibacter sp.]